MCQLPRRRSRSLLRVDRLDAFICAYLYHQASEEYYDISSVFEVVSTFLSSLIVVCNEQGCLCLRKHRDVRYGPPPGRHSNHCATCAGTPLTATTTYYISTTSDDIAYRRSAGCSEISSSAAWCFWTFPRAPVADASSRRWLV